MVPFGYGSGSLDETTNPITGFNNNWTYWVFQVDHFLVLQKFLKTVIFTPLKAGSVNHSDMLLKNSALARLQAGKKVEGSHR